MREKRPGLSELEAMPAMLRELEIEQILVEAERAGAREVVDAGNKLLAIYCDPHQIVGLQEQLRGIMAANQVTAATSERSAV